MNNIFWSLDQELQPELFMYFKKNVAVSAGSLAAIFHLSPFESKMQYWRQKFMGIKPHDVWSVATEHGQAGEKECRDLMMERNIIGEIIRVGSKSHPDIPFGASPDGLVRSHDGVIKGLEIKCPMNDDKIPSTVDEIWEFDKGHAVIQSVGGMEVFAVPAWYLVFYSRNTRSGSVFEVHRNEQFWSKIMIPEILEFMNRKTVPPRAKKNEKQKWMLLFRQNLKIQFINKF